jgi:hypothetical protein
MMMKYLKMNIAFNINIISVDYKQPVTIMTASEKMKNIFSRGSGGTPYC